MKPSIHTVDLSSYSPRMLRELLGKGMRTFEANGATGVYTIDQHPHATHHNGARVVKVMVDDFTDAHQLGALGTVVGSIGRPDVGFAYFVEWDDRPGQPTMAVEKKLGPAP